MAFLLRRPLGVPPCSSSSSSWSSRRPPVRLLVACVANEATQKKQMQKHLCTYGHGPSSPWLSEELHRLLSLQGKETSEVLLTRGSWNWDIMQPSHYQLHGMMTFHNVTRANEIFINDISGRVIVLSDSSLNGITSSINIESKHPDGKFPPRDDGYWRAYIIRAGGTTAIKVILSIRGEQRSLEDLQAARIDIEYVAYGPQGRSLNSQHVILPLNYPIESENSWRKVDGIGAVLPIKTHILSHMDDPLNVLDIYVLPHTKEGDVVAIAETPLAIMQGRFRHPCNVHPTFVARMVCRLFHPTSSLATACGMQALIDISGKFRVLLAVLIAVIVRLFGVRGMFYRLAGEQARLIDDVTGTLPPYDQFISLGPIESKAIVNQLKKKTGLGIAVVDVNDLRRVQILAASDGVDYKHLEAALLDNPSGNDNEQTPFVILRRA